MPDPSGQLEEEKNYLESTLSFLRKTLHALLEDTLAHRKDLIEARKDMVENTTPFSTDFERLTEIVQFLSEVNSQTIGYTNMAQNVTRYKKLIDSPYFGRFDFIEDGFGMREKIYIGPANVMDRQTHEVYVYDWRAPISSIFYRYEKGKADYATPTGISSGEVILKRQYKIKKSILQYFFDCDIRITDEILQEILGQNASPQMKNIVETIQKEQDIIIRDTDNELLLVQGTAGSGKTSIALHRIAFLLYEGLRKIRSNNILIISPNDVFSQYISGVLPELGEENVVQATFDDLAAKLLGDRFTLHDRETYLENLIGNYDSPEAEIKRKSDLFKGSKIFIEILNRWIQYFGRKLIPFEDVYFHGVILENKQLLKDRFLRNEIDIPMAKQLERIENMLLPKTHPFKEERLERIEKIVAKSEGRDLEIKQFSRLLAIKESESFRRNLRRFTSVDYFQVYQKFFSDPKYIYLLAKDLALPEEIEEIIKLTHTNLQNGHIAYGDYAPLLFLKLKIHGNDLYSDIRHVVIDEAQDYSPLQYEVFNILFRHATYTVLGDIHQSIDKNPGYSIYDEISDIMNKKKTTRLFLQKSYRSTVEINQFSQRFLGKERTNQPDILPFERHGHKPRIVPIETADEMDKAIAREISDFLQKGYKTIAVMCRTQRQAETVYSKLRKLLDIYLIRPHDKDYVKGPVVISSYMAKGLEYDVVILYGAGNDLYSTELDRKLLYISCTRALHELVIYYSGEKSPLL
ncbi:MAG: UvrD-helicase domain-containing protein [Peptococcaceae bacterium]|nr:UvrD-helicase domain-containing protein [Peptococcaceae bacterium]